MTYFSACVALDSLMCEFVEFNCGCGRNGLELIPRGFQTWICLSGMATAHLFSDLNKRLDLEMLGEQVCIDFLAFVNLFVFR